MNLTGKVALITGGGSGIGATITKRFIADGAKVCITGRRQEALEKTAKGLPAGSIAVCAGDVSKYEDVKRMIKTAVALGGKLDVLVNNAAADSHGGVLDLSLEEWNQVIGTNMTGPFMTMKEAIPHMIKAGGGSVINIASLAGIRCMPSSAAYSATKSGLIMLTQQAALDYGPSKVRCNVICPGAIRTEMLDQLIGPLSKKLGTDMAGGFAFFSSNVPLHRVGKPEEIAALCSFLASDESGFMTGSVLVMDGGAHIVDVSGATITSAANK